MTSGSPNPDAESAADPASDPDAVPDAGGRHRRKFEFPSAITVLAAVLLVVWSLSFIIPSGVYDRDAAGNPLRDTYHRVPAPQDLMARISDFFMAPVNGLYGVQDPQTGQVSPSAVGAIYGSVGVFLFVLAIGAFITVVFATGALDTGIALLAHRLRNRGWLLVAGIMALFALLGSVEGWAEETLGFYGLIVPLMLALGYDRLVASSAILLSSGVGALCSTVNPFATGVASAAAGVSIGDGIVLRTAMLVVLTSVTIGYVLRYGHRVRRDPATSLVGFLPGDRSGGAPGEVPPLTGTQRAVLAVLALSFALMIFSVIPWSSAISGDPKAEPYRWELGWSFPQLSALFIAAAVLVGVIARLGEKKLTSLLTQGAGDFIAPALVVALARGVAVIMNNSKITDTVLHAVQNAVTGTSSALFAELVWVVNLPLAFLIPSTSGHATLAMPVLAPLAGFAGVPTSLVVTAWAASNGFMNLWIPTSAVIMGGLALAKVGYDTYLRFIAPLLAILAVLIAAFLMLGAWIS
ncbi:YfcC family protein [Nocardia sp. NPDC056100]|uniref:YfcC family protein n=1 Tax=Nocardia sp. NPDC056100 TaxID=3345712 RepID=UPI0035D6EAA0